MFGVRVGHDEIREGAVERRASGTAGPGSHSRHVITTSAVSVAGDQATAEATGAGTMEEKDFGLGKGKKAELAREMITATVIKTTGRFPMNHWQKGKIASAKDKKWAADYKPVVIKADKEKAAAEKK